MLYYTFNLINKEREQLQKNDDSEFINKVNSAIGEVNSKLDGKAFALVSSVAQKGRRLRCCAELLDYSITPEAIGKMINDELDEAYRTEDAEEIEEHPVKKYYVDDVNVEVIDVNVQYLDENGKLIAENIKSFCKRFMLRRFPNSSDFIIAWKQAKEKLKFLVKLSEEGLFIDELRKEYGKECDVYDIILSNTYGIAPLTREQRTEKASEVLNHLDGECHDIFADIMHKYVEIGISALEKRTIIRLEPFTSQYGTSAEIVKKVGGTEKYLTIIEKLKQAIYGE